MPKYYVASGTVRDIVEANNPMAAAVKAFRRVQDTTAHCVSRITWVNEHGWDTQAGDNLAADDIFIDTEQVIAETWG